MRFVLLVAYAGSAGILEDASGFDVDVDVAEHSLRTSGYFGTGASTGLGKLWLAEVLAIGLLIEGKRIIGGKLGSGIWYV
jgi:hypothetical protein